MHVHPWRATNWSRLFIFAVETRLPITAYTGRNKLTFKFKNCKRPQTNMPQNVGSLEDLIRKNIHWLDTLISSSAFNVSIWGGFWSVHWNSLALPLQIKGKYTYLLTSVKRPKAHSRGFTSVKCPLSVTGGVSVLGALILKKQYMNFFGTSIIVCFY